jgi:peptidoglycan/LPS O-acetylase OafA/YrhL
VVRHGSNLSRFGASGKPGAVQSLRIIPVSYAFVFVLFVLSNSTALTITPCQFLTALTYTKNYACGSWIDGHLWSLAVEEQYYLLWPFMIAWFSVSASKWIAALAILVAPFSRAFEYMNGSRLYAWLPSNADALMIGSLAAIYLMQQPALIEKVVKIRPGLVRILAVATMALPVVLSRHLIFGAFTVTLGPTLQSLSATYLICSYANHRHGISYTVLNNVMLWYIGMLSYSLYVWQQLFFTEPATYGFTHPMLLEWPMNVIGLFLTAIISYHFFERPLMSLRRNLRPKGVTASYGPVPHISEIA